MSNLKIIVPLLILALQVIMKLVVGRSTERKNYLELICELPTNFIFLSISFSLVYIFLGEPIKPESVITFIVFIIFALIVVAIFRKCKVLSDATRTKGRTFLLVFLILINYPISLACLYFASEKLLNEKPKVNQVPYQEIKKTDKCK